MSVVQFACPLPVLPPRKTPWRGESPHGSIVEGRHGCAGSAHAKTIHVVLQFDSEQRDGHVTEAWSQ